MKMADFKEHAMQFSPVQSCFSNLYNSSPRMKSVEPIWNLFNEYL